MSHSSEEVIPLVAPEIDASSLGARSPASGTQSPAGSVEVEGESHSNINQVSPAIEIVAEDVEGEDVAGNGFGSSYGDNESPLRTTIPNTSFIPPAGSDDQSYPRAVPAQTGALYKQQQLSNLKFMLLAVAAVMAILIAVLGTVAILISALSVIGVPLLAMSSAGVTALFAAGTILLAAPIVSALALFSRKALELVHTATAAYNADGKTEPLSFSTKAAGIVLAILAVVGAALLSLGCASLLWPALVIPSLIGLLSATLAAVHITAATAPAAALVTAGTVAVAPFIGYTAASTVRLFTSGCAIARSLKEPTEYTLDASLTGAL